jgi:ABC-type multidrug transport system permease subunit
VNWFFLGIAARKDLRRVIADPWRLGLWLGIPLLIGTLMTALMGGSSGPKPTALLYLDDRDETFLSSALTSAFSNEGTGGLIQVERLEAEEALARLNDNRGSALLVIPEGFGQAVLEEEPITLELRTNPAQRILPGILEEILGLIREGVFYAHRLIGEELQLMIDGPQPGEFTLADPQVAMIAVRINQVVNSLSDYFDPVLLELESGAASATTAQTSEEAETGSSLPASFYMLPSVLMMALFFLAQGLSEDLWSEREAGTLRRSAWSPNKVSTLLAGKLLAVAAVFLGIGALLFVVGFLYHDYLPWTSLPLAVLWWSAGGVAIYLLMALVQMACTSRRGGSVITNLIMFPLLMLGGSFFPFEAMPTWMAEIGRFTPNGWVLEELKVVVQGRAGVTDLLAPFGALMAVGAFFLFLLRAKLQRLVWAA